MNKRQGWVNFLALLPGTLITVLVICIAFLRFYNETDFGFMGLVAHPREWSNRFTVAALLATLANFGVEWNRRNRETNRLAEAEQRRVEEAERTARRTRIEVERDLALLSFMVEPTVQNQDKLRRVMALLVEYRDGL